jgi:hypothetical protein
VKCKPNLSILISFPESPLTPKPMPGHGIVLVVRQEWFKI